MGAKYAFKRRPYKHQVQGVKFLTAHQFVTNKPEWGSGGALLMEPRTGKTKTAIDWMGVTTLKHDTKKWVVVCPNRVIGVWMTALLEESPLKVSVVVWDKDGRKETPLPRIDGFHDLYVVIINYDAFATPGKKTASGRRSKTTGRWAVRRAIERWVGNDQAGMILDESHKIKSPSGKAATAIVDMTWPRDRQGRLKPNAPLFVRRAILTGTPVTKAKRCFDIYMQWQFLNPFRFEEIAPTSGDFKNYFGRWTHANGFPQWLAPLNQTELQRYVHRDAFAQLRSECYDLPTPKPRLVNIQLRGKTAEAYDQMVEDMLIELADKKRDKTHVVDATIPIVQILRLAQISSGFVKTTEGTLLRVGREKLEVMEAELSQSFDREEKVIIAAKFKVDIQANIRLAEAMGFETFWIRGGMKRQDSDAMVRSFEACEDAAVIVCQPAAAGLGIDLSGAGKVVWYSLTNSWVDYTQMNDRNALNKNKTDQVYILASPNDRKMYESLQLDGDVARYIAKRPVSLLRDSVATDKTLQSEALKDALSVLEG